MKAYSKDLRLKVLAAVDRGQPRGEIVGTFFGVSPATVKRWLKKRRETGDVEAEPIPGPPARKWEALEERLPSQVRLNPDLTLAEHCELFEEGRGVEVSTATMSRAFERLGLPLKKSRFRRPSETRRRGPAGEEERGR
jgi:transposase